ncbi:hypothetical protein EDB83DRAFT_1154656 [Lactarius deliciosus]|nr:hypothetical protein EDB83DRAFT_1154656 [Lactarius deliciosus]
MEQKGLMSESQYDLELCCCASVSVSPTLRELQAIPHLCLTIMGIQWGSLSPMSNLFFHLRSSTKAEPAATASFLFVRKRLQGLASGSCHFQESFQRHILNCLVHGACQQTYGLVRRPPDYSTIQARFTDNRYSQLVCSLWCTSGDRLTYVKVEREHHQHEQLKPLAQDTTSEKEVGTHTTSKFRLGMNSCSVSGYRCRTVPMPPSCCSRPICPSLLMATL